MFDWVQMLTATLQPNQAETRFLPPQNCISLWKSASYIFLILHIFDILKSILYCIEDYITVSPARSVFHPRIKLHQNENLWNTKLHYYWQATNQRTVANTITVPIEKTNNTWSVGRRLKSLGGFVITYLLPGASGPALLSRNLQGKYSNHCGTHFQVAKVFPNSKLPKWFLRMLLLMLGFSSLFKKSYASILK